MTPPDGTVRPPLPVVCGGRRRAFASRHSQSSSRIFRNGLLPGTASANSSRCWRTIMHAIDICSLDDVTGIRLPQGLVSSASRGKRNHPNWPKPIEREAFHGVAGELVQLIEPHSEADPAALLIQFLAGFGNLI